jgi:Na+/melibiose symporter-like transporter
MANSTLAEEAAALPPPGAAYTATSRNMALLIAIGIFVSTFAQDQVLALLPFRHILVKEMHCDAVQIASFFTWCGLAWYFKPIFGILSDAFPIFGTRRRSYMLIGAMASTLLWAGYLIIPHRYTPFLLLIVGINTALVVTSTVAGGLLVEEGQRAGATGKLSSIRNVMMCFAAVIAGPIGGKLADRNFSDTAMVGSALCGLLLVSGYFLLREPRGAQADRSVLRDAGLQLKKAVSSRPLLLAALFTFLVTFAPGFSTPLYLYQTNTLHFSDDFIGSYLMVLNNVCGIAGSLVYVAICRKFDLRGVIVVSIIAAALSALGYLHYHTHHQAEAVECMYGFFSNFAQVMLLDVAAQATPVGCEAMAYALLMSAYNLAARLSDVLGSWILEHWRLTFPSLVWINALTTLLTLIAIPLLPMTMLRHRDGEPTLADEAKAND